MSDARPSALYRCEKCGHIIRDNAGKDALGHIHYDDEGNYLGKDGEGRFIEFEDDGRELPIDDDLTHPDNEGVWRA